MKSRNRPNDSGIHVLHTCVDSLNASAGKFHAYIIKFILVIVYYMWLKPKSDNTLQTAHMTLIDAAINILTIISVQFCSF